jgi:uncharacterized membrane protein HdeD (DUF308 family)
MKLVKDLAYPVLMLVVGILLCVMQSGAISVAVTILGIALIVVGILDIINNKNNLAIGIIEIVVGVVMIVLSWVIATIIVWIVAALLVIYGVYGIYQAIVSKAKGGKLVLALIVPIIYIIAGILLFLNGFPWAWIVAGVILIVYGILGVINAIVANKN